MMMDNLIKLLNSKKDISGWIIIEQKRQGEELYFIRRDLEMNRSKDINNINVTVYKDFEENGTKYKGSSTTKIHPTMSELEVNEAIDDTIYASQFVKNEYYPLVEPTNEVLGQINSNLSEKPLNQFMDEIVEAVFKADEYEKGSINSTEIFLTKLTQRLISSTGIDYSYDKYIGAVEFITTWKEDKEEIELYKHIDFGSLNSSQLTQEVNDMLELSKGRANAEKMPSLGKFNIILTDEAVSQLLTHYYFLANSNYVHEKISQAVVNESIQGENIIGDKINIKLNPFMTGSTRSASFDESGFVLKEVNLIEDGILKGYWGSPRHAYYLGIEPTGNIGNIEVKCGDTSIEEMKKEPYLELVSFSAFQVDHFTGNFGGEVRFAWYFDGNKIIPVSGGSIAGNVKEAQSNFKLSKEQMQINQYKGPKAIQMKDIMVAGNE